MQKPLPAKGTRDFESLQIYKRNYILDIIKKISPSMVFFPWKLQVLKKPQHCWVNMVMRESV